MPKTMETAEALALTQKQITAGVNSTIQLGTRVPLTVAVEVYQDSIAHDKSPSAQIRDVLDFFYRNSKQGVFLELVPLQRRLLDGLAAMWGVDRNQAAVMVLNRALESVFSEEVEKMSKLETMLSTVRARESVK